MAAASLSGLPMMHQQFDLPLPDVVRVSCPHFYQFGLPGETEAQFVDRLAQELEDTIQREGPETVAAFIAEPVQGAGGVVVPPAGYFAKVQAILKKHDILLIADEVITGFGRLGEPFGTQVFDLEPDMITVAKMLTSAYVPTSALYVSDQIYQAVADASAAVGVFARGLDRAGGAPQIPCRAAAVNTFQDGCKVAVAPAYPLRTLTRVANKNRRIEDLIYATRRPKEIAGRLRRGPGGRARVMGTSARSGADRGRTLPGPRRMEADRRRTQDPGPAIARSSRGFPARRIADGPMVWRAGPPACGSRERMESRGARGTGADRLQGDRTAPPVLRALPGGQPAAHDGMPFQAADAGAAAWFALMRHMRRQGR